MQLRRRLGVEHRRAKEKRKAKEELAENNRLLGRHGEKLNNLARTV
jgi:hypothetical protein